MDDSAPGPDGDSSDSSSTRNAAPVVNISPVGEAILDVTFENSAEAIQAAKKSYNAAVRKPAAPPPPQPNFSPLVRAAFRVELSALKKNSKYFDNLLSNTQFSEANLVKGALADLKARKVKPEDAEPTSLPWISIADDDESTRSIGREKVFEDMLRILHGKPTQTSASSVTMIYVTNLAMLADRFDCQAVVSRHLNHGLKFKWPMTSNRPMRAADSTTSAVSAAFNTEKTLRQKILAAWLLEQPPRLQQATREIIMRGSSRWSALAPLEDDTTSHAEAWWHLPDGLERELQFRRDSILNTIASIQRHFLALYSSRSRQCKLGYDSSSACDSFQLGQMLKFFTAKNLAALVDFGPSSLDPEVLPDASLLDVDEVLATLRQCPGYQVDNNHTNCGLRTRLEPIVEFIRSMLSSNVVPISHGEWRGSRETYSWAEAAESRERAAAAGPGRNGTRVLTKLEEEKQVDDEYLVGPERIFEFTRSLAGDHRVRFEGPFHADRLARSLFTADSWNWSPEF